MPSVLAAGCARALDFEFEGSYGMEMLRMQIMSITGIVSAAQRLFCLSRAERGELLTDTDIADLPASELFVVLDDAEMYSSKQFSSECTTERKAAVLEAINSSCTRVLLGSSATQQPRFLFSDRGLDVPVCTACAALCKSECGAVEAPMGYGSSAGGGSFTLQTTFSCGCTPCLFEEQHAADRRLLPSAEGGAMCAALASASSAQVARFGMAQLNAFAVESDGDTQAFRGRLLGMMQAAARYQDQGLQAKALARIPVALLCTRTLAAATAAAAAAAAAAAPIMSVGAAPPVTVPAPLSFRDGLLHELARWFKTEFFAWTNSPPCAACGSTEMHATGGAPPTPEERRGGAGITELHACGRCGAVTRFPRYNDPGVLLDSRRGRCGEWANAFTLCAVALGFQARHVTNWEDHVWTEVYSRTQARWLHVDSCECAVDAPLLYEGGWGKKMSYTLAAGLDELVDVSRRYTRRWPEVLQRRGAVSESWLAAAVAALDALQRGQAHAGAGPCAARLAALAHQRAAEERALQAQVAFDDGARRAEETAGRISGALAWRLARAEAGGGSGSAAAAAGGAAGSAGTGGAVSSSLAPFATAGVLEDQGVVVPGWLLAGATTFSPSAAAAASTAVAAAAAATTAAAAASPPGTGLRIAAVSSFGSQLLALTSAGTLVWATPPPGSAAHAGGGESATAPAVAWKPVNVSYAEAAVVATPSLRGAAASGDAAALRAWPPAGETIAAIAAYPRQLRFFAVTSSARVNAPMRLWLVSFGEPMAAPPLEAAGAGAPASAAAAAVPRTKPVWLAAPVGNAFGPLLAEASTSASVSLALAGDALFLLSAAVVWIHRLSRAELEGEAAAALHASDDAAAAAVPWSAVAAALDCSHLAAVKLTGGEPLAADAFSLVAIHSRQDVAVTAGSGGAVPASNLVLLTATCGSPALTCGGVSYFIDSSDIALRDNPAAAAVAAAAATGAGSSPALTARIIAPRIIAADAEAPAATPEEEGPDAAATAAGPFRNCECRLGLELTGGAAGAPGRVPPSSSSSLREFDWCALSRVGLASEASSLGRHCADLWEAAARTGAPPPPPLRPRVHAAASGLPVVEAAASVTLPLCACGRGGGGGVLRLPTQPGLYDLRLFRGVGFGQQCVFSAGAVLAVLLAGDSSGGGEEGDGHASAARALRSAAAIASAPAGAGALLRWVPVLPAAHVCGLGATAVGGNSPVWAVTETGDLWRARVPSLLSDVILGSPPLATFAAGLERAPRAPGPAPKPSDGTSAAVVAGAATGVIEAAAGPVASSSAPPPPLLSSLPLPARIAALYKQLTVGCGRSSASSSGGSSLRGGSTAGPAAVEPCCNPHCANAAGPMPPNAAALRAVQLAALPGLECDAAACDRAV